MDELLLFTLTSPSLHFRWTGSFLQFLLTSSSLNSDGRAPTIHSDEPSTAYQADRLLLTIHIDEAHPSTSNGRAPTIDEPSTAYQTDGLLPTIHIDEAHPSTQMDELLLFTVTSPPLHIRQTGFFLQFILTKLFPQLRWTSSYYSH